MKLSDFRYPLPRNLIAKYPANPRDTSRLMLVNRTDESITSLKRFADIAQFFKKGDCLVVNETRVFPARLFGRKEKTNARIEVFLLRELNKKEKIWDAENAEAALEQCEERLAERDKQWPDATAAWLAKDLRLAEAEALLRTARDMIDANMNHYIGHPPYVLVRRIDAFLAATERPPASTGPAGDS